MTVYEVCIRNEQNQWLKIPGGMTHKRVAKAKEELEKVKLRYPEAFVSSLLYIPQPDGSLWRRPLAACTPLPWLQPTHEQGNAEQPPKGTSRSRRHLKIV